jgi:thiol-disulfide isomerase/thioredoxin
MNRWLALITALLALAAVPATADDPKPSTEQGLLAQLKTLAAPPTKREVYGLDADELRDFRKERAKSALKVLGEFEERFPRSAALPEARSEALTAVGPADDDAVAAAAAKVAKALRDASPRGSDLAAQADLYLLGQAFRKSLGDVQSVDDFRAAWAKRAGTLRQEAEQFLAAYPNYRPGADAVAGLARMAQIAGDESTEHFLVALVEKYQPGHPLARAAARHRAVGKEFDFAYTPLGSDRPARLKDLRGKVVVVYFWAVWCVPCKAETKRLAELYDKHHDDGLEVIAVSLDEKEELVPKFVRVKKIKWPQWVGEAARRFAADWGVDTLPVEFVIDRRGRLRNADAVGKLEEMLPALLQEKE